MPKLVKRLLAGVAALAALLLLAVLAVSAYASSLLSRRSEIPAPAIRAATEPSAIARGEQLFRSVCADCHAPAGRAVGRFMADVPAFLGRFYPPNVTAHPTAGVGAWSDAELARVVRSGVKRDGRAALIMPIFASLSDEDLSAILGFMRSGHPMFAPDATVQPPQSTALAGRLILAFVVGIDPKPSPPRVSAPPRGPTADYGRYLTMEVLQCGDCHTSGFDQDKARKAGAFAGGFEMKSARGEPLLTPNITPDPETGIGAWSADQFVRALRDGIRPDGTAILPPMLRYRALDEQDLLAVHAYLRTIPAVRNAVPKRPRPPAKDPGTVSGEELFVRHGCADCHGEGAPFRDRLRDALALPVDEVAARIRNPERFSKGAQMPSYAEVLDDASARELAVYVHALATTLPAK